MNSYLKPYDCLQIINTREILEIFAKFWYHLNDNWLSY